MTHQPVRIALDIGSRSIKAAAFDRGDKTIHKMCQPINASLKSCLNSLFESLQRALDGEESLLCALTGSNSCHFARFFGLKATNGILATYLGVKKTTPHAGAILEIGGEQATFIRLDPRIEGERILQDFFVNSACSAGTGAFLEQEAHRFNLSKEEFGRLAAKSGPAIPIAGRCAVFAKTDIVHLHQNGVPLAEISRSLCRAVAQNVTNELILSHEYRLPLVLVGGVAANIGIREALRAILKLDEQSFLVPDDYLYAGVIGAFQASLRHGIKNGCPLSEAKERIKEDPGRYLKRPTLLKPLSPPLHPGSRHSPLEKMPWPESPASGAFVGIDVGSTSTNIVCLSTSGDVLAKENLPTRGQALEAVYRGLAFIKGKMGAFDIQAVGITGSGRRLVAEIIGADVILNEITAHSLGGTHFFPELDTIFDIGGQDSKWIRLHRGTVLAFAMNKVCSAGTGSFLEEMSELLGLQIIDEFSEEAMRSTDPIDLGERCTVFMATELLRKLREGEKRPNLAAGLCYSVVKNYLSRVVGRNAIGHFVSFQGGVAGNPAIVSAFENFLQKPVHVHDLHEVAGAIGVGLYASRQNIHRSRFRGFKDLSIHSIKTTSFECSKCANSCYIHLTRDTAGKRYFSGGLCDRYEGKNPVSLLPRKDRIDLFAEREKLLYRGAKPTRPGKNNGSLGLPKALHFFDLIPFWSCFFNELGIDYFISESTKRKTILKGVANCPTNPCLPIKTAYGHCLSVLDDGAKKVFIPSVANLSFLTERERMTHICPASQAWPFTARALFSEKMDFLTPTIRFSLPPCLRSDIIRLGHSLGFSTQRSLHAFHQAMDAQKDFFDSCRQAGQRIFSDYQNGRIYAVLLSRSYTASDPIVSHSLKKIFDELNILGIPLDMVPFEPKTSPDLMGMYWYYGRRYLQTIDALADRPGVVFIHLSNFGCGPDSFIIHFLRKKLRNRPYLELEIDDHSQFTGISTRLEAFALSLDKGISYAAKKTVPSSKAQTDTIDQRKLLIPQMSVHAYAFESSFRAFGIDAEVLPLPDNESINWGKQAVSGGECLPCSFLIGDMLRHLKNRPDDQPSPAFFMISGDGPCRLGQYPYLQRLILEERGFSDAVIFDASQDKDFYDRFRIWPASFKRKTWRGVVAIDLLFRKWRETRAYVDDKERFDELYKAQIKKLCGRIQHDGRLESPLEDSFRTLDRAMNPAMKKKPVVAVLGENYVRCNPAANGQIADQLEDFGAEVWFPSLYEWVYYGNWTARLHCLYERNYKKYLSLHLIDAIQHLDEYRISRSIKGKLRNLREPSLRDIFHLSSKYIPNTFEGETMIEVARTVDFYKKGVGGVIHVVPFGCLMGTIVETLSERLSKDLSGFPLMTLYYDGLDFASQVSKLEGFMIRVRMWQEKRRMNENTGGG